MFHNQDNRHFVSSFNFRVPIDLIEESIRRQGSIAAAYGPTSIPWTSTAHCSLLLLFHETRAYTIYIHNICGWYNVYPMIESSFSVSPFLGFVQFRQMQIFKYFMQFLIMRLRIFNNIYLFNVTCSCANIYVSKSVFKQMFELYEIGPILSNKIASLI